MAALMNLTIIPFSIDGTVRKASLPNPITKGNQARLHSGAYSMGWPEGRGICHRHDLQIIRKSIRFEMRRQTCDGLALSGQSYG